MKSDILWITFSFYFTMKRLSSVQKRKLDPVHCRVKVPSEMVARNVLEKKIAKKESHVYHFELRRRVKKNRWKREIKSPKSFELKDKTNKKNKREKMYDYNDLLRAVFYWRKCALENHSTKKKNYQNK